MSNISKTVRNSENVSIDVKQEVIYELLNGENIFSTSGDPNGQRSMSNSKNFEVEYLKNGMR